MTHTTTTRRVVALSLSVLLAGGASLGATVLPATGATPHGAAAISSPASASSTSTSATGFGYFMYPTSEVNVGACTDPVQDQTKTQNVTAEPFYANDDCGFSEFTLTGAASKLQARFLTVGATEPFDTAPVKSVGGGKHRVHLEPPADWPSGKIRMQVVADGAVAGTSDFGHNLLAATFQPTTTTRTGKDIPVAGTLTALDSGPVVSEDAGVPGTFTLQVTSPDGTVLHSQQVTAAENGAFTATVPGAVTKNVRGSEANGFATVLGLRALDASYQDASTGAWSAADAGAGSVTVVSAPEKLLLENSFVSSVGWVKPGETYPSRILVKNPSDRAFDDVTVTVSAADGSSFTQARPGADAGTATVAADTVTWTLGSVPAAGEDGPTVRTLVLESQAADTETDPQIVWKNLSSTATLQVAGSQLTDTSHGPKVIPEAETFDTARYGDRPFPVVPVDYLDRSHQADNSGDELSDVINSPEIEGSTFNLLQEISLGQLFPQGTVPSAGVASRDFSYEPGFDFTAVDPQGTCTGATVGAEGAGSPLYGERIKDGFYQLPGTTAYYGADRYGSALAGAIGGVGPLMDIDSACGPTGKLVYDAAAIADPEIDYSDYDTDKDGVVDFFMVVYAGCGGHGASQLTVLTCPYADAPYDNVWPHSSSLEFYYTDDKTGLSGYVSDDQLRDLEGRPLFYTDASRADMTTTRTDFPVFVRVGPYNVNPETAIDKASVISHEYGHSLGLPDFYSLGSRETYGDWNLMATDKSQNMDVFSRQEMGWIVPEVLQPGQTAVKGMTDSKEDTHSITWQQPDGTPYTLTGPDVHNAQAYVAKLPGRVLIDPAKFNTGDKASATHAWWSGSGNDFGCAPEGGRNLDVVVPGLADLPKGTTVKLQMKSLWDIEWDYDYGFVLTSTDGGETYTSRPSAKGYTTASSNPNQNACMGKYGNGLTGTSGSYQAGSAQTDRLLGSYKESVFLADEYDISNLAGERDGVIRFSYATDPGLARPGWFIDDLKVVATQPSGEKVLLDTDLESDGDPDDPRFFNGGCKDDLAVAARCTKGWNYVDSSSEAPADHAYYLELRDRSGFDLDGNGQNDRADITFQPGLSLVYTDEAHGYGNVGTDNPPAQTPVDANPQPGNDEPNLADAAFTKAGVSRYSDSGAGHTDNYDDPAQTEKDPRYPNVRNPWRFRHDCLTFDITAMSGEALGPEIADGDLTADVVFDLGDGCGEYDYGHLRAQRQQPNTPPNAAVRLLGKRGSVVAKGKSVTLSAKATEDAETPDDLDYSWDFGDGGTTKDATGPVVKARYGKPGVYTAKVTVTDPKGLSDTATTEVTVVRFVGCHTKDVSREGGWRARSDADARGGRYCDSLGKRSGKDRMTMRFTGPRLSVLTAHARNGGAAKVIVDGKRVGVVSFEGRSKQPRFGFARVFTGLGEGPHTVRLVMTDGVGYVDGFMIAGQPR